MIGYVFILNGVIDKLSNLDIYQVKKSVIQINSAEAEVSNSSDKDPLVDITSSVVIPDGETGEDNQTASVELIKKYFPNNYEKAVKVFTCESHLDPKRHSEVDKMADGRSFSIGTTQINLSVSTIGGVDCSKAFKGVNKNAVVVDEKLYDTCVKLAEDEDLNLKCAQQKFEARGNFGAWEYCNQQTS